MVFTTDAEMHRQASDLLADGWSVILDAAYNSASFRQEAFSVARKLGELVFSIRCTISDGCWELCLQQRGDAVGASGTLRKSDIARLREERLG